MSDALQEYIELAEDWAHRTENLLLSEIKRLNIGVTDELYNSLSSKVVQEASGMVNINLTFLLKGRYVDMGAGRGYAKGKIETTRTNRERVTVRKPKKWYSKPFYGRLNALMGVTGAKLSEQAVASVIEPLKAI